MGWQRRTFRCWPLLGPTRLEARGSRGAQGDGEQGTQQWPPGNVRRCGRHNTRAAYGQGRSPSLESTHRSYLQFYNCFSCGVAVFLTPGLNSKSVWKDLARHPLFKTAQCLFMACQHRGFLIQMDEVLESACTALVIEFRERCNMNRYR